MICCAFGKNAAEVLPPLELLEAAAGARGFFFRIVHNQIAAVSISNTGMMMAGDIFSRMFEEDEEEPVTDLLAEGTPERIACATPEEAPLKGWH
jgi:hypothetical protein